MVGGWAANALAQADDTFTGFVAAGIANVPQYEGSDDYEIKPLVAAQLDYRGYSLEILGTDLRAEVSPWEWVEFGPSLSFRGGREDDVDNEAVRRLREIDDAFEAGVFVRFPFHAVLSLRDRLSLRAEALFDLSDTYDGYVLSFAASYDYQVNDVLTLGVSLQTTYASEDYQQTYFGIDADNAVRSGLAPYEADAGFKDVGIRFSAKYMFTQEWGVIGLLGYQKVLGDAADSPIVEQEGDANQWLGGIGVVYEF
ncbi:MAG: MipA/OmpV family protein [Verrucomicrobiota bacterium JB022]|nr:MipA/OmpV family protein [Verrucomicrobiota bacterium JB022]